MTTTKATTTTAPSGFDTEPLLSKASLLTYALQGLYNNAEGGSEIEAAHLTPIFDLAFELSRLAGQLHDAARRATQRSERC